MLGRLTRLLPGPLVAGLLTVSPIASPQRPLNSPSAGNGEIRIEVRDPSGAAMRATGKRGNLGTGTARDFETDAAGVYTFTNLTYGRYRLEVSRDGFATRSLSVDVESEAPISRTVRLELKPQAVSVDVVATTPVAGTDLPFDSCARQ